MLKLKTINFIDALIEISVVTAIPLLLVSQNISVEEIGLILAIPSLVFVLFRLLFASISDLVGLKKFFVLNAVTNVVSTLSYAFAGPRVMVYAWGKVFEGLSSSAIWAVNRTAVFRISKERDPSVDSAQINGFRILAYFVGMITIGYLIQSSFVSALLFVSILGFANFILSSTLPESAFSTGRITLRKVFSQLDVRKKSKRLIRSSIIMSLATLSGSVLFRLALPLYLDSLGFSYVEIGFLLAVQWLTRGLALFSAVRSMTADKMAVLGSALIAISLIAFPFAPKSLIFLLIAVFGLGMGAVEIMWEKIIFTNTRGSKTVSTDIGIIHMAPNVASVISLGIGGFLIAWFGYAPLFIGSAILYSAYLLLGLKALNSHWKDQTPYVLVHSE